MQGGVAGSRPTQQRSALPLSAVEWGIVFPVGLAMLGFALRLQVGPLTIGTPEIGALGYFAPARILDSVGLVSPEAVKYYPLPLDQLASDNTVAPGLIRDLRPEYVVSLDQFIRRSLLADPDFLASYELVDAREARIWASTQVLVYRRLSPHL